MTRRLEEVFNLPPMDTSEEIEPSLMEDELVEDELVEDELVEDELVEETLIEPTTMLNALSNAEKLDSALSTIAGLDEHDTEMDIIASKAIQAFTDLTDLCNNVPDAHVGRIMEVAATMLKTAMEAKDSKVNRKLRTLEIQLKKAKLDSDDGNGQHSNDNTGIEFDRNDLLKRITAANNTIKDEK